MGELQSWNFIASFLVVFIFTGIMTMVLCLGIIQFAASYCNFSNGITKFFSQTAYTVYLIHPFVICPVFYSFIEILRVYEGVDVVFCDNTNTSKTHLGHNYLVWAGWIYVVVVSQLIM